MEIRAGFGRTGRTPSLAIAALAVAIFAADASTHTNISARQAMCHMLCEFGVRLESAGLADSCHFELPMTQDQLADCLGITPVHVNRVLRSLGEEGLIIRNSRLVEVPDRAKLKKAGGFDELYLHLDLMAAA